MNSDMMSLLSEVIDPPSCLMGVSLLPTDAAVLFEGGGQCRFTGSIKRYCGIRGHAWHCSMYQDSIAAGSGVPFQVVLVLESS